MTDRGTEPTHGAAPGEPATNGASTAPAPAPGGRRGPDGRIAAALLAVAGTATAWATLRFRVAFVTDPLGPRAFPWLASALLLVGAVGLWRRPGAGGDWPRGDALRRVVGVGMGLLAWSVALPLAGFLPATTLLLAWLGRLFGARTGPGLAVGLLVATGLWALFGFGLGLPLPAGPGG